MSAPVPCTRPSTLAGTFDDSRGLFPYIASTTLMTVATQQDLFTRLSLLPSQAKDGGWRAYKALYEEAERRSGKREASEGTNIHAVVQALAAGYDVAAVPEPARSDGLAVWDYIQARGWLVVASEAMVANLHDLPEPTAGTLDLMLFDPVAEVHFVGDVKSVATPTEGKYSGLKWGIQTACYGMGSPLLEEPPRDQWGRPLVTPSMVGEWPFTVSQEYAVVLEVHRGHAAVAEHWLDLALGRQYAAAACHMRAVKKQAKDRIYIEAPL